MKLTVAELAELVDGRLLQGDPDRVLSGFEALDKCGPDGLSFFGNERYLEQFEATKAGAVLVPSQVEGGPEGTALVVVDNPIVAFDAIVRRFGAPDVAFEPGIHPTAVVAESARLDPAKVQVGPCAVISGGCEVGDGTWIGPHVVLSERVVVGTDCQLHPHVSLREGSRLGDRVILHAGVVIGADGYGFEFNRETGRHEKIRQAGIVEIGDDVEVGANTTIDRARFGSTVIGEGTKIDNLVQIGHNARIGRHCLIVAQSGISGSATLGDYVTVAAQGGIAGHITIGDQAILGGRTGAIADLEGGQTYFGYPARPIKEFTRQQMFAKKVPGLVAKLKELEARLAELEQDSADPED